MEYRPLPKIVARASCAPAAGSAPRLFVGDMVKLYVTDGRKEFWRTYRVDIIDGDRCIITSDDHKHTFAGKTETVAKLKALQRLAGDSEEKAQNAEVSHTGRAETPTISESTPPAPGVGLH